MSGAVQGLTSACEMCEHVWHTSALADGMCPWCIQENQEGVL
ncbi:hypothetical protein [Prescottella equi]|nr:hypothetical protein [Prescottella equi]